MGQHKWVNGRWEPPFTEAQEKEHERRFDEMVETGRTPSVMTDSVFLEGRCNGNQFEGMDGLGDYYAGIAQEAGVNPKGKTYISGLAAFPGDPRAWVDGRGDVRRVLEERGWGGEGAVSVKPREESPAEVGLDPQLVSDEVDAILQTVPEPALVDREDLTDQVYQARKPHWVKD